MPFTRKVKRMTTDKRIIKTLSESPVITEENTTQAIITGKIYMDLDDRKTVEDALERAEDEARGRSEDDDLAKEYLQVRLLLRISAGPEHHLTESEIDVILDALEQAQIMSKDRSTWPGDDENEAALAYALLRGKLSGQMEQPFPKKTVVIIAIVNRGAIEASASGKPYNYQPNLDRLIASFRRETGTQARIIVQNNMGGWVSMISPVPIGDRHRQWASAHEDITEFEVEELSEAGIADRFRQFI